MSQRSLEGCLHNSLFQKTLKFTDQRELGTALYPELKNSGILTARAVQLNSQILILLHRCVDNLGQRTILFLCQLIELCDDVIRQFLTDMVYKMRHIRGKLFNLFFLAHLITSCFFM